MYQEILPMSISKNIIMNGVIVLNKPTGKTSHDMVGYIRRLTGIRRVGHTGTLDPLATGVLPICIGSATKACELLTCENKAYRAELVLGMTTDTLDAEGEILSEQPVMCKKEDIEKAVKAFEGDIFQIPPMYSAIKKDGKKLYELAREGKSVEREKRSVTIFKIDIEDINLSLGTIRIYVECSKGTYIRTLCDDIGMKLGCGAYMNTLERVKSGKFSIENSHTEEELKDLASKGELESVLIPVDELFSELRRITVNERQRGFIVNGVRTRYRGLSEGECYRVYDEKGEFLCISRCVEERLTLEKAFWNKA